MADQDTLSKTRMFIDLKLVKLTPEYIKQIDEMLVEIGQYGEVHIVVENGYLRYINKVESRKLRNREDEM